MKLPSKIKINGVDYQVLYLDDLKDGEETLYGCVEEDEMTIKINKGNQTDVGMYRTLLHEIWHVILYEFDMRCRGYNKRTFEDEEELAELFSRSLYQLARENPELFEYIE